MSWVTWLYKKWCFQRESHSGPRDPKWPAVETYSLSPGCALSSTLIPGFYWNKENYQFWVPLTFIRLKFTYTFTIRPQTWCHQSLLEVSRPFFGPRYVSSPPLTLLPLLVSVLSSPSFSVRHPPFPLPWPPRSLTFDSDFPPDPQITRQGLLPWFTGTLLEPESGHLCSLQEFKYTRLLSPQNVSNDTLFMTSIEHLLVWTFPSLIVLREGHKIFRHYS